MIAHLLLILNLDVELEQGRGMIRGPARYFGHNAFEPELAPDQAHQRTRIDRANRIALINPFIEAFGQQSRLPTIRPNQEALHRFPPQIARRIITSRTFSRSQGQSRRFADVCDMSALPPTTAVMMQCRERQKSAKAQNRCAIARCAGSPTASAVIGGEIVNSGRGALS